MPKGKRNNPDTEGVRKMTLSVTPEDLILMRRLQDALMQSGPTPLFRALMKLEGQRRGFVPLTPPSAQEGGKS